jgi:hypothetical protein
MKKRVYTDYDKRRYQANKKRINAEVYEAVHIGRLARRKGLTAEKIEAMPDYGQPKNKQKNT